MDELYEAILNMLNDEYKRGSTYQEMAKKYKISYTHLHNMMNGVSHPSCLSLLNFAKMFPNARISLDGNATVNNVEQNTGIVSGAHSSNVLQDGSSDFMKKILSSPRLSAEEKVKVMQVIQDIE